MAVLPYLFLILGWAVWLIPFIRMKRASSGKAQTLDRRARVGVVLQTVGYLVVSVKSLPVEPGLARFAAEIVCLAVGCLISAAALRALGRHWRIDAGLNPDHELVSTGPYRRVRHPIYLSMLFMLLAMGAVLAMPAWIAAGVAIFVIGTEIRVRIEDALLKSRFGERFEEYKQNVWAYVPFVR